MSAKSKVLCFFVILAKSNGLLESKDLATKIQNYLNSTNTRLSENCSQELNEYSSDLLLGKWWALKMLDATSKIPSGILSGEAGDLGDFDQCLEIQENVTEGTIFGKYCLGSLNLSNSLVHQKQKSTLTDKKENLIPKQITFAVCSPSACSAEEAQNFYSAIGIPLKLSEKFCQDTFSEPELTQGDVLTIAFFAIILAVIVISTSYDFLLYYTNAKPAHVLLVAFSAKKNGKTLLENNNNPNQLLCLHGIRGFTVMWVILFHRYFGLFTFPLANHSDFVAWVEDLSSMIVLGSYVAVDTFLLLGGLVISSSYMNARAKGKTMNILKYYVHRYIRLTPAFAAVILISATLFKHFGSGPYYPTATDRYLSEPCQEYWWSALLYVQNYVNPLNVCVQQAWYLSVDMQLFLLSPLFLLPMYKHPKFTLSLIVFLIICLILSPLLSIWFLEIRGIALVDQHLVSQAKHTKYYYYPTHTRAATWFIGLALGYIIYKTKKTGIKVKMKKLYIEIIVLVLWGLSLTILGACVYVGHDLIVEDYNKLGSTLHLGLVKPLWGVALSWVIFACVHGYGGPINWILSLPIFQFLSKLSYSMYLLHVAILLITTYQTRKTIVFGNFEMLYRYCGDCVLTLFASIVWVLAFEYPFAVIDSVILGDRRKEVHPKHSVPQNNSRKEKKKEIA